MTLGEKIRTTRLALGMTQAQLAGQDFSVSFICKVERGSVKPSLRSLAVLARKLRRPLSYFMEGTFSQEEASTNLAFGFAYLSHEDLSKASEYLHRVLELARALEEPLLNAGAIMGLAAVALSRGELPRAARMLGEARAIFQRHRRSEDLAQLTLLEGNLRMARHDFEGALKAYLEALDLVGEEGIKSLLKAEILIAVGDARRKLGLSSEAATTYLEALVLDEERLDLRHISLHDLKQAEEHFRAGDLDKTQAALEHATTLMRLHQAYRRIARGYEALGELQASQGRWQESCQSFARSVEMFSRLGELANSSQAALGMAQAHFAAGELGKALQICKGLLGSSTSKQVRAEIHYLMGRIYRTRRQWRRARSHLEESLALLEQTQHRDQLASVARDLALLLAEQGREKEAILYFQKSATALSQDGVWPAVERIRTRSKLRR
ncbi:MAG: helix-turn-helix transcriptional regulator [Armatimonadota bacterium]|nr:helix-turn-helix transcriptional regulator [Armatimonadota bacterium]MDR5703881.1 helix-turn-helix transcriptional regulator [Armatimonadota bacterium]MDR7435801.1 helix-turn-helix transcriptional regulator [Armatimonadota bacterium]